VNQRGTLIVAGFPLGGTVGVGTVLYAVAIGPISHVTIPALVIRRPAVVGRPGRVAIVS
jgi:uncharacterized membrane protein YczE